MIIASLKVGFCPFPGKIEANSINTDFKITAGICQISIDSWDYQDREHKYYTIKTLETDALDVLDIASSLITVENLKLDKTVGYVQGGPISKFTLTFAPSKDKKKTQWNCLLKLLNITEHNLSFWKDASGYITHFSTDKDNELTIKLGDVIVISNLNCGKADKP